MTTRTEHTLFELGRSASWDDTTSSKGGVFQPYAGLRIGADYAEMSSYYYTVQQYQDTWGVLSLARNRRVSIFPSPAQRFGFHVALFYSYASNKRRSADLYDEQHQPLRRARRYLVLTAPAEKNGCLCFSEAAVFHWQRTGYFRRFFFALSALTDRLPSMARSCKAWISARGARADRRTPTGSRFSIRSGSDTRSRR